MRTYFLHVQTLALVVLPPTTVRSLFNRQRILPMTMLISLFLVTTTNLLLLLLHKTLLLLLLLHVLCYALPPRN